MGRTSVEEGAGREGGYLPRTRWLYRTTCPSWVGDSGFPDTAKNNVFDCLDSAHFLLEGRCRIWNEDGVGSRLDTLCRRSSLFCVVSCNAGTTTRIQHGSSRSYVWETRTTTGRRRRTIEVPAGSAVGASVDSVRLHCPCLNNASQHR